MKITSFASPAELGRWLRANYATEVELWVKVHKKGSGVPSVDWEQIVIEALCWGWVDGVRKSLDGTAYLQRITPRTRRSAWSKRNTEHVERLIAQGRMQPPGLAHVAAAQADGRWANAYASSREMTIPADFLAALDRTPKAKRFFETLKKSSRYTIAYGLATAKRPETRQRRFEKFIAMLLRNETPGFGFKKEKKAEPVNGAKRAGTAGLRRRSV